MPRVVTCPSCSSPCSLADNSKGQVVCPICAEPFRVGPTTAPPAETLLLPAAPPPASVPAVIGRYEVRHELGAGAFGKVYRAYDPQLDRDVALKLLKPEALGSPGAIERFRREARAAARMLHAHVVPVYDCGEHDGAGYVVSAFIEGRPLSQCIPERGMEPKAAVRLVVQLLDALAYAHEHGVMHRDVKPANCLVDGKGHLYLTDFGLAGSLQAAPDRLTRLGTVMGTPAYMAPEQAAGATRQVGPHSDQYAAGVVLYELLTGQAPFAGPVDVILFNVLNTEPNKPSSLRPGLDQALESLCLKALAKRPDERFAGAAAFADRLRDWLAAKGTAVRPPAPQPEAPPAPRRRAEFIVCQQGGGTHATIGEAVRAAPAGSTILIRPGLYREALALDKAVTLQGDGPPENVTITSAEAPCLSATAEAVARGLTLRRTRSERGRDGYAVVVRRGGLRLEGCDVSSESLACVAIHGPDSNPTLRQCRIHHGSEGGVLIYQQGRGTLEGCEIFANQLAGVEINEEGDLTLRDCKVHDNQGDGVLVQQQGRGTVEGCEIHANRRAGVVVRDGGDPTVRHCKVHDNEGGILVDERGRGTVEGCEIHANRRAGVEVRDGGDPTVRRCRSRDNHVGVRIRAGGRGAIEGCDLRGNNSGGVCVEPGGAPILRQNLE
jgi:hypothetical protein